LGHNGWLGAVRKSFRWFLAKLPDAHCRKADHHGGRRSPSMELRTNEFCFGLLDCRENIGR
jgi:hypothetical protein